MKLLNELEEELVEQHEFLNQLKDDISKEFDLFEHYKLLEKIIDEEKILADICCDIKKRIIIDIRSEKD